MKPVLVDTCVWSRHFHQKNQLLTAMLEDGEVWSHPTIIGELTMGSLRNRKQTVIDLETLDRPPIASFAETRHMVEQQKLWGLGIHWNDAQILASAILGNVLLWTFDNRLQAIAKDLGLSYSN